MSRPSASRDARWKSNVGKAVTLESKGAGTLRYVGTLQGKGSLVFAGIELNNPKGSHNGTFNNKSYFECPDKCGVFAPIEKVKLSSRASSSSATTTTAKKRPSTGTTSTKTTKTTTKTSTTGKAKPRTSSSTISSASSTKKTTTSKPSGTAVKRTASKTTASKTKSSPTKSSASSSPVKRKSVVTDSKLAELEAIILELTNNVEEEKQRSDDLAKEVENAKEKATATEEELVSTNEQLAQAKSDLEEVKAELEDTKKEFEALKDEHATTTEELNGAKDELAGVTKELATTKDLLEAANEQADDCPVCSKANDGFVPKRPSALVVEGKAMADPTQAQLAVFDEALAGDDNDDDENGYIEINPEGTNPFESSVETVSRSLNLGDDLADSSETDDKAAELAEEARQKLFGGLDETTETDETTAESKADEDDKSHTDAVEGSDSNPQTLEEAHAALFGSKADEDDASSTAVVAGGSDPDVKTAKYKISVKTGDVKYAGTDAKVSCDIQGKDGKTGPIPLEKSLTHKNKFERDHVDVFEIDAADVGEVEQISIEQDGGGMGSAWYLDEVFVDVNDKEYKFPCNAWLDKKNGTARTLTPEDPAEVAAALEAALALQQAQKEEELLQAEEAHRQMVAMEAARVEEERLKALEEKTRKEAEAAKAAEAHRKMMELEHQRATDEASARKAAEALQAARDAEDAALQAQQEAHDAINDEFAAKSRALLFGSASDDEDDNAEKAYNKAAVLFNAAQREEEEYAKEASEHAKTTEAALQQSQEMQRKLETADASAKGQFARELSSSIEAETDAARKQKELEEQRLQLSREAIAAAAREKELAEERERQAEINRMVAREAFFRSEQQRREIEEQHDKEEDEAKKALQLSMLKAMKAQEEAKKEEERKAQLEFDKAREAIFAAQNRERELAEQRQRDIQKQEEQAIAAALFARQRSDQLQKQQEETQDAVARAALEDALRKAREAEREADQKEQLLTKERSRAISDAEAAALRAKQQEKEKVDISNNPEALLEVHQRLFKQVEDEETVLQQQLNSADEEERAFSQFMLEQAKAAKEAEEAKQKELLEQANAKMAAIAAEQERNRLLMQEKGVPHTFFVKTSDIKNAGTDSNVGVFLSSDRGTVGPYPLKKSSTHKDPFERNHIDIFTAEIPAIGDVKSLQVEHDGKGFGAGWHLEKVDVAVHEEDKSTFYTFPCNSWIEKKKKKNDPPQVTLAPAAVQTTPEYDIYTIKVKTANTNASGTSANVQCWVYGRDGEIGPLPLTDSLTHSKPFRKGHEDQFLVIDKNVGEITQFSIEHDGGKSETWKLDEVNIDVADKSYHLPCDRWFALSREDGETHRTLIPKSSDAVDYTFEIQTAFESGSGAEGLVSAEIFGTNDKGEEVSDTVVFNDAPTGAFSAGNKYIVDKEVTGVSNPREIQFSHVGKGDENVSWTVEEVGMINKSKQEKMVFPINAQVGDGNETHATSNRVTGELQELYHLTVTTSDIDNAGTDANVFVELKGSAGTSGPIELGKDIMLGDPTTTPLFEQGQVNKFSFYAKNVGKVQKCNVGHNQEGFAAAWHLATIEIVARQAQRKFIFKFNRWLPKNPNEDDAPPAAIKRESEDNKEEDAQSRGFLPAVLNKTDGYDIHTFTGDCPRGDTDEKITIKLLGTESPSPRIALESEKQELFKRGNEDMFYIPKLEEPIGDLQSIEIGHDGSGNDAAWYLEKVVVVDHATKKTKVFPCQNWLSDKHADNATRRVIQGIPPTELYKYKVKTVTSALPHSGTGARVWYEVYGENADGQFRHAKITFPEQTDNTFTTGGTYEVEKEVPGIAKPKKINVYHDGSDDIWLPDSITLTRDTTYVFPCREQLGLGVGDQEEDVLERSLEVSDLSIYDVTVITSDIKHAGTNAPLFIYMYGSEDDTGKVALTSPQTSSPRKKSLRSSFVKHKTLDKGSTAMFSDIAVKNIGELQRVKIGTDGSDGWHLSHILVSQTSPEAKHYNFPCHQWLSKDRGDEMYERELDVRDIDKEVSFDIGVFTSEVKDAGTSCAAFLEVTGKNADGETITDMVRFYDAGKDSFATGQESHFSRGLLVSKPTQIRIGHDGKGSKAKWHVNKVVLKNLDTEEETPFIVRRWMAKGVDDEALERTVVAQQTEQYTVTTYTADIPNAGTDAAVYVELIGDKGNTSRTPLEDSLCNEGGERFESGKVDKFVFTALDVGRITSLRIGHDDTGSASAWNLAKVEVDAETSGRSYVFELNDWISADEGLEKEIKGRPAGGATNVYSVMTTTTKLGSAGTDANVSITITGDRDQYGPYPLRESVDTTTKFESNQTDRFEIEAPELGAITSITMEHDGKGIASGWHLQEVNIIVQSNGTKYRFPYNDWLPKDDKSEPKAVIGAREVAYEVPYTVTVVTSSEDNSGTRANVFMKVEGVSPEGQKVSDTVTFWEANKSSFANHQSSTFQKFLYKLETPTGIVLGHDGDSEADVWHPEKVILRNDITKVSTVFFCRLPIGKKAEDGEDIMERNFTPQDSEEYQINVYTTGVNHAATTADVHIQLEGGAGQSQPILLSKDCMIGSKKSKLFDKKSKDMFVVEAQPLEPLKNIVLSTDGSDSWQCEKVEVLCLSSGHNYTFLCEQWLSTSRGDGETSRKLPVRDVDAEAPLVVTIHTSDIDDAGTDGYVELEVQGKDKNDKSVSETLRFWDAKSDDFHKGHEAEFQRNMVVSNPRAIKLTLDGKGSDPSWHVDKITFQNKTTLKEDHFIIQKWLNEADGFSHEMELQSSETYEVTVVTTNKSSAGTNANVSMSLKGKEGSSPTIQLTESLVSKNPFEAGNRDKFIIETRDVGDVESIKIGHDGKGLASDWHLALVQVLVKSNGQKYVFPAHTWFSDEKEDGATLRELSGRNVTNDTPFDIVFHTTDDPDAGTDCQVVLEVFGFSDGKLPTVDVVHMWEADTTDFTPASKSLFTKKLHEITTPNKIRVTIDGQGKKPKWHLDRVSLTNKLTKETYVFICREWLGKGVGDGQMIREMQIEELEEYDIFVTTTDIKHGGTAAPVHIVLIGDGGETKPIPLHREGAGNKRKSMMSLKATKEFSKGTTESFKVEAEMYVPIRKIRIGHDGSDGWHLDKVAITAKKSNKQYVFPCRRWFSNDREDKQYEREINSRDPAMEIPYEIEILTGEGQTDSNLFLEVFGKGKDGEMNAEYIPITNTKKDLFTTGKTYHMSCGLIDIASPEKIRYGQDSTGKKNNWLVDKIVFINKSDQSRSVFPGSEWIGTSGEANGIMEREIAAATVVHSEIEVATSDFKNAGADGAITVKMHGSDGRESRAIPLRFSSVNKTPFERGQTDLFSVDEEMVGQIEKIHVAHDTAKSGSWHCSHVCITTFWEGPTGQRVYYFACDKPFSKAEGDMNTERDLVPTSSVPYSVMVQTNEALDAGTHAQLFLTIFGYGWHGESRSDVIKLDNKTEFDPGTKREFNIRCNDLAYLSRIEIGHDGSGSGQAWLVDDITMINASTQDVFHFHCGQWLQSGHDRVNLPVSTVPIRVMATDGTLNTGRDVLFYPWSDMLRPESAAVLDRVAKYLKDNPYLAEVVVSGHCNGSRTTPYLNGLSLRRAECAIRALTDRGVRAERMLTRAVGCDSQEPGVDNAKVTFELEEDDLFA